MSIPINKKLYEEVKNKADEIYKKPSAYKSGYIVKEYKRLGGKYQNTGEEHTLTRWYAEKWGDIGHQTYPVYRPTVRINKSTPLLASEINKKNLQEQVKLKQIFKGDKNLPKFKKNK